MRGEKRKEELEPSIIFEDSQLLILNKPAGWIVNEAETTKNQPTIQEWIRGNFQFPTRLAVGQVSNSQALRSGIVHRLDKETSGILVVAKTRSAFEGLQAQFRKRQVEKTYLALVHGDVSGQPGRINTPIARLPWNRKRFGPIVGGRSAQTSFKLISLYKKNGKLFSLVEVFPKTGRTHQIRVHMKHIGHPIVGDQLYAGRKTARADRKSCPRLFLHATGLSLWHPVTREKITFSCPPDSVLDDCLDKLEKQG